VVLEQRRFVDLFVKVDFSRVHEVFRSFEIISYAFVSFVRPFVELSSKFVIDE
jgi:hypothetical protein